MTDATPLQTAVRNAIARSGRTRDWFDSRIKERSGTTGKMLYDIDRGKSKAPAPAKLAVAEEVLGLEPGTLVKIAHPTLGDDARPSSPAVERGEAVPVIALDLSLSMGPGTLIEEFVESEPVIMDLRLLQLITRTPSDCLRLVRGIGDSMEPTLRSGDRVLVDLTDRQATRMGGIYWIDYFGAHGIKRLHTIGNGRLRITSDNPLIPDIDADLADVRIEGRVIWFARDL